MARNEEYYQLQCLYTKAILHVTIQDIVFDTDILHGLHPIQGCFIGIEYAKIIKASISGSKTHEKPKNILTKYAICRYGNNSLLYQDRQGLLGFECKKDGAQFLMDPRDIALSRELIEEFDSTEAFCIGVLAGLKFANPVATYRDSRKKVDYLRLVE